MFLSSHSIVANKQFLPGCTVTPLSVHIWTNTVPMPTFFFFSVSNIFIKLQHKASFQVKWYVNINCII